MNKKLIYGASSLMLLSGLGFTSCQSDNILSGDDNAKGSYILTVKASKGDDKTRTEFEEKDGNLISTWNAGDKLIVADINGVIGSVTLVSGEGTSDGVFEGDVKLTDETSALNLWYIQNKTLENGTKSYKYEIGKLENGTYVQDGTFGSMAANDVMSVQVSTNDNRLTIDSEKKIAEIEATMERRVAEAHFTLSFADNTVLDVNDVVTVSGSGVDKFVNFNLVSLATKSTPGDFEIKKATKDNDLYLTLLPHANVAATFTVVKNDKTYTGTLKTRDWVYGEYYRAAHGKGVEVEMVAGVDHSKNPLAKWATTNLDLSTPTKFAVNQWDTGQYFQFGRNCGFTGYSDARNRYALYCKQSTTNPGNVWGFNVYNGRGNGVQIEATYTFSGLTDTDPAEYFYIADTDISATNNDWWPQRANLEDTWSTRATAEGWTTGDPSPEGWHLATTEEYEEIMPKQYSSSTLSEVFGKGEIRENGNCTYAIRWDITKKTISNSNVRYVLAVKCLVVEKGTSYSQVDWNDENVVVRNFPSAGYINSGYSNFTYWYLNGYNNNINYWIARQEGVNPGNNYVKAGNQRAALPVPVGLISYVPTQVGQTVAVKYIISEDHSNFRTSYWTADGDCFGFSYDLDKQWPDPYFIGTHKSYKKTFAMPLRCVKD